jgi:hypothetical protein
VQDFYAVYVGLGSKSAPSRHGAFPIADILARIGSVAKADVAERPSSAKTGREQAQQRKEPRLFDYLVGARWRQVA